MRIVLQRVTEASVMVDGTVVGSIGKGFLMLLGVAEGDTEAIADKMIDKALKLRIFEDADGKTNLSIDQVDGELLVVSQFTLYADCRKGNRPSFNLAGAPDMAESLYEYTLKKCEELYKKPQHGIFGADMKVSLVNDGPFTVILDSEDIVRA